ncbi:MAG: hypothetical protein ACO26G_06215 [Rickettsiales bacterium]
MFYKNNKVQKAKNKVLSKEEEVKNNLSQQMKIAVKEQDLEKINLIQRIENEIEKLFVIKKIYEDSKLLGLFKDDVNRVVKDSHFHLIEMILLKEIELLMLGDLEAIEMLEGLKKRAQKKIDDLNKIALKVHQNALQNLEKEAPKVVKPKYATQTNNTYKPLINYDGFHVERTLGGEYIQVLDADLKNLVGQDILNSKPEQLSNEILQELKDFRRGAIDLEGDNSQSSNQSQANQVQQQDSVETQSRVFKNKVKNPNSKKWQKEVKQEENKQKNSENEQSR